MSQPGFLKNRYSMFELFILVVEIRKEAILTNLPIGAHLCNDFVFFIPFLHATCSNNFYSSLFSPV